MGGGTGPPDMVTVTTDLGYSQLCQHIGPTRPKGSVPHQLGRDLAYAEVANMVHGTLPTVLSLYQSLPIMILPQRPAPPYELSLPLHLPRLPIKS